MTSLTKRSACVFLAASLLFAGCAQDDDIRDNDPPGSTILDESNPDGDVLVPTTDGPETIPATTAAG